MRHTVFARWRFPDAPYLSPGARAEVAYAVRKQGRQTSSIILTFVANLVAWLATSFMLDWAGVRRTWGGNWVQGAMHSILPPLAGSVVSAVVYRRVYARRLWTAFHAELAARGLCTDCGYSLDGNVSGVCPECGTAARPAARSDALAEGAGDCTLRG